jgi:5'-nucleotidase
LIVPALSILHTNDFHGKLTPEHAARVRALKDSREPCLYFDTGDCIKAGNLAIPLKEEKAWALLAEAGCDAGVLGNRETHPLPAGFEAKLSGRRHPLLCANLRAKKGPPPLPDHIIIERGGVKVGVFGVMVPIVTERMATQAASAFLWDQPLRAAQRMADLLRQQVDLLVALTHIGHRQDLQLAELCPSIDVIFGGHSHTVLTEPTYVGSVAVCQGGSHGRYIGVYRWNDGRLEGGLQELGAGPVT